jgi:putative ABC transport system ATP-binding protein
VISARSIRKSYQDGESGEVRVLDGLDLEVAEGDLVAVVGPSGSGKSTLLHVLGGLDVQYSGQVEVGGVVLSGLSDQALARFRNERVGFVFQSFHLVPSLSALENVLLPSFFAAGALSRPEEADRRAREVLDRVGLSSRRGRAPAQLSGGERQRVAIARALFARPRLLLCDEPTGNLDARTGAEIVQLFLDLNRDGLTVLCVTHEERMSGAARRVLRLRDGRLHEEGGGAA